MKMKLKAVAVAVLMSAVGMAQAAGFALYENNASGLGTAFAGQAAVAQDASTIFFNPAGLTQIQGRQLVGTLTYIHSSGEFSNEGSTNLGFNVGDGGDGGVPSWVPAAFFAMDVTPTVKFGVGVYAPFGLETDWDTPWVGMTQAIKSEMKTINVNPTLAWKVNDSVSLGLGVNWQYIEAELTSATGPSTVAKMDGDDESWGWNVGALFKLGEATRIGVSYRSDIDQSLEGDLKLSGLPATKTSISADITLPEMASISLFHKLTPQIDLLADATWTGWGSFDELAVKKESGPLPQPSPIDESWDDAWRFTLGFQYHADEKWTWRAGVAYDQTPVPDAEHRTARIPDEDRISVAIGAQYRMSKQTSLDFGYMHIFFDDADIDHCEPESACPAGVTLKGSFDVSADILGAQFTYNF
jgi:long-chain fatty acid transport protein